MLCKLLAKSICFLLALEIHLKVLVIIKANKKAASGAEGRY